MLTSKEIESLIFKEEPKEIITNKETEEDKIINAFNDKLEEMTEKLLNSNKISTQETEETEESEEQENE